MCEDKGKSLATIQIRSGSNILCTVFKATKIVLTVCNVKLNH